MPIRRAIVVGVVVVALCGGYIAEGRIREQTTEPVTANAAKEGIEAKRTDLQLAEKPADAVTTSEKSAKTKRAKVSEDPDAKIIRASAEAYTNLYNAHDVKGLAALFGPKAQMIDEDGRVEKGREAIEKAFVDVFKEYPKASMAVAIQSIRVLTPMLAIEEGTARSKNSPDDREDVTVYVAIHVKVDGKWQLACVRDWDAPPEELTAHDRLQKDLSWLVGKWIDESPDSVVQSNCTWHDNGNFLMQEFHVNVGGKVAMSGTMRIGWDAVAKQFKSWVFDSHGGYSTGAWLWDGNRWIVKMQGATAKGEVGSSTNFYRPVDEDTMAWGSFDRMIDGKRLDDIPEIIVKRSPPPPAE